MYSSLQWPLSMLLCISVHQRTAMLAETHGSCSLNIWRTPGGRRLAYVVERSNDTKWRELLTVLLVAAHSETAKWWHSAAGLSTDSQYAQVWSIALAQKLTCQVRQPKARGVLYPITTLDIHSSFIWGRVINWDHLLRPPETSAGTYWTRLKCAL